MKKIGSASSIVISLFSIIVFASFFAVKAYHFCNVLSELSIITTAVIMSAMIAFVALLVYAYFKKSFLSSLRTKVNQTASWKILVPIIVLSAALAVGCYLIFRTSFFGISDRLTYIEMIEDLVKDGYITRNNIYARKYTYTFFLALYYYPLSKLIGTSTLSIFITNLIVFSCKNAMLFSIVKRFSGNCVATVVTAFMAFNFEELCYIRIQTHEHFLTLFTLLVFWMIFCVYPRIRKTGLKCAFMFLICIAFTLAYRANAAGKVFIVAFIIYFVIKFLQMENKKYFIKKSGKLVACAVLAFCVCFTASDKVKDALRQELVAPITDASYQKSRYNQWWRNLYVGSDYASHGEYYTDDVEKFEANITGVGYEERSESAEKSALTELKNTYSSPSKAIRHLFNKMYNLIGYYGYGSMFFYDTLTNKSLFNFTRGLYYDFSNFIFCLICLMIILSTNKKNFKNISPIDVMKMFVIGFTIAMMIYECNNKYGTNMIYFIVAIFGCSIPDFRKKLRGNKHN